MDKETKHTVDYIPHKLDKETGFSIPEHYLNNVDDAILATVKTMSFPKANDRFSTPDNYFSTVENDILAKLDIKETKAGKVISFRKKILQFGSLIAAASVLLFIYLHYFNANISYNFEDITEDDIAFWYENGYGTTNGNDLATIMEDVDFDNEFSLTINDDSIEDYLNTIDNTILLNEIQEQ